MKHILKAVGSLLLDQFVGMISGCMLVVCVAAIFNNNFTGYLLAFCISFGFYAYVTYNSSFKSGFRDVHRIQKDPNYHGYLYKGLIAGALSAIPLLVLYIVYLITDAGILAVYFMIANMYWTWPMGNMFPNHMTLVMILAFVPIVIIPWIGYIAGYKNFLISDLVVKYYKQYTENKK